MLRRKDKKRGFSRVWLKIKYFNMATVKQKAIKVGDTVQVYGGDYKPFFTAKVVSIERDAHKVVTGYNVDTRHVFPQFSHINGGVAFYSRRFIGAMPTF